MNNANASAHADANANHSASQNANANANANAKANILPSLLLSIWLVMIITISETWLAIKMFEFVVVAILSTIHVFSDAALHRSGYCTVTSCAIN